MRPGEGIYRLLVAVLMPLCIWGLMSSLVLHLVELRSMFVVGGEWRLQMATLAFAAAVVLLQRLAVLHGRSLAKPYAIALGVSITLFVAHNAWAYRLPAPPLLVFAINEVCFVILWWVGHKVSAACAADSDEAEAAVAQTGILSFERRKREASETPLTEKEREERWAEKLPVHHPGRVILYFSLFAIPAFGAGIYLFDAADPAARLRMGALLFIYLWCAFSLLFLSHLGQLRSYFAKREVTLPELVGITWVSIGVVVVTVVLFAALFCPQPPSASTAFVRSRVFSVYRGWESKYGVKDTVGRGGGGQKAGQGAGRQGAKYMTSDAAKEILKQRYTEIDKLKDPYLSKTYRNSGWEPEYRNVVSLTAAIGDSFRDVFDAVLKIFLVLGAIAGLVAVYAVVAMFWKGLSEGLGSVRWMRRQEPKKRRWWKPGKKKPEDALAPAQFLRFTDPFFGTSAERDGNALVRYLWEATLAFCADAGAPCLPDRTPLEFVASRPAALQGFEEPAHYIAGMFTFSEFSDRPVPDSAIPELKQYWSELQAHAGLYRPA